MKKIDILGVGINFDETYASVCAAVEARLKTSLPGVLITTINPEFIVDAQTDLEFNQILNDSFIAVPDGSGIVFAHEFLNQAHSSNQFLRLISLIGALLRFGVRSIKNLNAPQPHKLPGVDLVDHLCAMAATHMYSVFILGGRLRHEQNTLTSVKHDLSKAAAQTLKNKYHTLNIIGASSNFKADQSADEATLDYIHTCMREHNISAIDLIFVGYGHGKQEKWLARNIHKIPAKVGIGVGGTFDYLSGEVSRAPKWVCDMNLEWLYRLITQPWRYKRILKAFVTFPMYVLLRSTQK